MRAVLLLCLVPVLLLKAAWAAPTPDASARAQALLKDGNRRWAIGSPEQRRSAIAAYEEAAKLTPSDVQVLNTLGRAYLEASFLRAARGTFESVLALDPDDPDAEYGLGKVWTRTWLDRPDSIARAFAYGYLTDATHDRPAFAEAYLQLAAVDIERNDGVAARAAAESAYHLAPDTPQAQLGLACLLYRGGEIERADSLFAIAIPELPRELRRKFDDCSPLLTPEAQASYLESNPNEQAAWDERFWAVNDPDPTTPLNEARLEFRARLAYAMLLFGDPFDPHWRGRTGLYLRYGRGVQVADERGEAHGEMPMLELGDVAPTPTPGQLARLGLQATADGHAVFAPLPPGVHALRLAALVARFESDSGGRLLAQVELQGTPADTMRGECVVLDSTGAVAGRAARELTPGACDPARQRTADFAFEVPPGRYRVVFSVRDGRAGKGITRADVVVAAPARSLAMSDVVLACGPLDAGAGAGGVRLNPNVGARVGDDEPVHAYFEVYHLRPGDGGATRFEYDYTVLSAEPDRRPWFRRLLPGGPHTLLSYRSEQQGFGTLRRQYINVPAGTLGYGRFRLVIGVHDLGSGRRASRTVEFEKAPAPAVAPESR